MLVIEDGSQVAGATSYVTAAEIETYAEARGVTLTTDPEILSVKAMDYIESQSFLGSKVSSTQALQWPRTGVTIDGYELAATEIPNELKNAQMATAISIASGVDPLSSVQRGVKMQQVGDLKVEYDDSGSVSISRTINASLAKLVGGGSGGVSQFKVTRG
jgi:hypothetical protein